MESLPEEDARINGESIKEAMDGMSKSQKSFKQNSF